MAERNFVGDALELSVGVAQGIQPAAIERRHDFGGQNGIDADVVRKEFGGPLARQRELRAFAGGVSRGIALPGQRNLGADIDNRSLGALKRGQRIVSEGVIVNQVLVEAFDKSCDAALFQSLRRR